MRSAPVDVQRLVGCHTARKSITITIVIPAQAGIQTRRRCEFIMTVGVNGFPPARE
jgi:hypothetical protein